MRIIITGATGFIGKHLSIKLAEVSEYIFIFLRNKILLIEKDKKVNEIYKDDLKGDSTGTYYPEYVLNIPPPNCVPFESVE